MNTKLLFFISLFFVTFLSFSQSKVDSLKQELSSTNNQKTQLKILNSLTKEMSRSNDQNQEKYLNQTITLAKKLNDYDLAAVKTRFLVQKYIYKGKSDTVIYIIEKLLKDKTKFKSKSSEGYLLLKRGAAYFNKELIEKATKDYEKAAKLFMESKDSIFAADAFYFAGQTYFNSNRFLKSIKRFKEAYTLYDKLGDNEYANLTLAELATVYGKNDFNDKAIYERNRIIANAKKNNQSIIICYTYANLFTSYYKKNELPTAEKYIDSLTSSISMITDIQRKKQLKIGLTKKKIEYYLKKENVDSVSNYIKKLNSQLSSEAIKYHKNDLLFYKAQYYKKKKEYAKSQQYFNELLDENNIVGDITILIRANKLMAEVLAAQNKHNESYNYLKRYTEAKDSERNRIKTNSFLYYQSQFETQRKDNEIYKKESEITLLEKDKEIAKSKRRILWILMIAIVVSSTIISFYIWKKGKQKRETLTIKIEKNKKELSEFTNQLLEKSKIQKSLIQELEKLKEEIGTQKTIEKIEDLTTSKILTQEDWYTFKLKFNRVHPNFFSALKNKGYNLTKSEERLLAMEKLYLDTNEIASMLAISRDSVTKSRSRLRKKINAPKGSSILDYLEAS